MSGVGTDDLDALLANKITDFNEFRRNQDGVWGVVNSAYLASRIMIAAVFSDSRFENVHTHMFMMWQNVLEYQMESFFLLIARRLDEGLAVLRMSSELSRDIARIGENEGHLKIWINRRSAKKVDREAYRTEFRFSDNDRIERYVHRLYDLASTFGIHGHSTTSISMKPDRLSPDGQAVILKVPDLEVYKTIEIWLASFFPIQELCIRPLTAQAGTAVRDAEQSYRQIQKAFEKMLQHYRQSLQGQKLDEFAGLN